MRILYIFPHPDDESFGPACAMAAQKRQGHEVFLLTLTKGGATRVRHKYGYSVEEMGEVRAREMYEVIKVLDLDGFTLLDLPDSGLKEMDPRDIKQVIAAHIREVDPEVVVSYPVHGISGFHDHLISHAVVKDAYLSLKEELPRLQRLAFFTLDQTNAEEHSRKFKLSFSSPEEIDCKVSVNQEDLDKMADALACYVTYQETIKNSIGHRPHFDNVAFEFFQEDINPASPCIFHGLSEKPNRVAAAK